MPQLPLRNLISHLRAIERRARAARSFIEKLEAEIAQNGGGDLSSFNPILFGSGATPHLRRFLLSFPGPVVTAKQLHENPHFSHYSKNAIYLATSELCHDGLLTRLEPGRFRVNKRELSSLKKEQKE